MEIKARIPGIVEEIRVQKGDSVKSKDVLLVMEAMKMQQPILCPADGTVSEVCVANGARVKSGEVLVIID